MQNNQRLLPKAKSIPHYLIIILISIIVFTIYHPSISKGIFVFDDEALIIDNPLIKNFSYLKDLFTRHLYYGSGVYSNFYRPIQSLSFLVDYHLWEMNSAGYHLTNVLIHILNALAVYFLVYLILNRQDVAIMSSLLFSVHTVLSWPVNYVASRADLLSAFFFFTGIIFYVLYKKRPISISSAFLYLLSAISFVLAILSKEISIIFTAMLVLYLYCFSNNKKINKKSPPNLIWAFLLITSIYIFLRATVLDFTKGELLETTTASIPLYYRLLTTAKAFMIYLRLLFLPLGLHMEWNIKPATSFLQDEVFLSGIGVFILIGFSYFLLKTSRPKFFAISWFFITLIPYYNIFPLAYFMGEAWLYVPSVGFFILLALYLSDLRKRSRLWNYIISLTVISLAVFYGVLTFKRADIWADPVKLYTEVLRYSPDNIKARINLGVLLAKSGSHEAAIKRYGEASNILKTDSYEIHSKMGNVYADKNMYDMALKEFTRAIELNPEDHVAHTNIGIIYKKKGDFKKAEEEYRKAIELNPNYALAYNNLGNIYLETNRYDDAITYYKKAIELNPHMAAFYENLGKAYKGKGMETEATECVNKAKRLK